MDARRYDRNADLLAQVFWHYSRLLRNLTHLEQKPEIEHMMATLQVALDQNDRIAKMAEQGLI